MAKEQLGTKRVCPVTGRKFYDLNKDPIVSPYTGESYPRSVFDPVVTRPAGASSRVAPSRPVPAPAAVPEEQPEVEETGDVELVSLEEAEEDTSKTVTSEEDIEIEDEALDADDDETFLEEEEEGNDDLSDVIGDVDSDEER